jgi:hypothetical protein
VSLPAIVLPFLLYPFIAQRPSFECVCVCVCVREREGETEKRDKRESAVKLQPLSFLFSCLLFSSLLFRPSSIVHRHLLRSCSIAFHCLFLFEKWRFLTAFLVGTDSQRLSLCLSSSLWKVEIDTPLS